MSVVISPFVGWIVSVVVLLIGWGFAPDLIRTIVRGLARKLGVGDMPNFRFGTVIPDLENSTQPYTTLYHVECVNKSELGWRKFLRPVADAEKCRVMVSATPSSGPGQLRKDHGLFTLGASSERETTLYVDMPFVIPIYWIAPKSSTQTPFGVAANKGYYLAGEGFMRTGLWYKHLLPPDIYRLKIEVICKRDRSFFEFELVVPELD